MTASPLSPSGEAAWQSLRQHIEWTSGFWLGWIFTDHTPSGRELFDRAAALVHGLGRRSALREPDVPEALTEQLAWLLGGADGVDGCVAIEIRSQGEDWVEHWDQFLLRLNERRELLRRTMRGGLLLITPTALKPHARTAAPDLWSIRSLALDVSPPAVSMRPFAELHVRTEAMPQFSGEAAAEAAVELAQQAVTTTQHAGHPAALTEARIRLARAHMAAERGLIAREIATQAVAEAPTDELAARALAELGRIEMRLDDLVAAERHYREALRRSPAMLSSEVLQEFAEVLERSHTLDDAVNILHMGLDKLRTAHEGAELLDRLRSEWMIFCRLGDIALVRGDLAGAVEHFRDALDIVARTRVIGGESPGYLPDEAYVTTKLGRAVYRQGNFAEAHRLFQRALSISQQIRRMFGDKAVTLRGEAKAVLDMSNLLHAQEDVRGSLELARHSLALLRTARHMDGDTPVALYHEGVALERVGDCLRDTGDLSEALDVYRQGHAIIHRLRDFATQTAGTLRDESIILSKIGRILYLQGELAEALEAGMQSLDLARRVHAIVGDLPGSLREEVVAMSRVADILRDQGKLSDALALYEHGLVLARRIHALVGDTAETLRDESITLTKVGEIRMAKSEDDAALALFRERLAVDGKYRVSVGDTPEAVRREERAKEYIDEIEQRRMNLGNRPTSTDSKESDA